MNICQKDIKTLWRSPVLWLTLALMTFISYWFLWQMIDKYTALQSNFAVLPNPPNITTSLWLPYVMLLAKLMILLVAYTSSFSIAQERSQKTLWYLVINQNKMLRIVSQKFFAQLLIALFVMLLLLMTALLLSQGGDLNWVLVASGGLGLLLYVAWLIALGLLVSAFSQSSATAFLASVVISTILWMLAGEGAAQEYGVNWLHLFSPAHHLQWMAQGELSLSSLLYFVMGIWVFLVLSAQKLEQQKS